MKLLNSVAVAVAAGLVACQSPRTHVTKTDSQGNYITTSDYQSMERAEFLASMRAGLEDFEDRVEQLRQRANELGGESLSEFSEWADELETKRVSFVNSMERTEVALVDDWPDQRASTIEAYEDLRECLDEAYEEVLDT